MKRILLALIALLSLSVCKAQQQPDPKVWTAEYEKALHDTMYVQMKGNFPIDEQRKVFVDCFVAKLKTMLPKGMESVSPDSVYSISRTAGKLCAQEMKNISIFVPWTPENEQALRTNLIGAMTSIDESRRKGVCDCFISELKLKDPKGFSSPMQKTLQDSIANVCFKKVPAKKSN